MNGKTSHVHGVEDIILLRCQHYAKQWMLFLSESQYGFFFPNRKIYPKIYLDSQGTPNGQIILEKNIVGSLTLLDFKTHHKATVIKTV